MFNIIVARFFKKYGIITGIILLLSYLLTNTEEYLYSAETAVESCLSSVIPSLFCFVVLTKILVSSGAAELLGRPLGRIFAFITGLPKICAGVYILSFISGFPSGVIASVELYKCGYISKKAASKLCAISDNTGPALPCLIIGIGVFGSVKAGVYIFLIQMLTSLIMCLIFREKSDENTTLYSKHDAHIMKNIVCSVEGSIRSIAIMCGYILIFSVVGGALSNFSFMKYILPFTEIVSGSAGLPTDNKYIAFILLSGALSFGGICVHFQAMSVCIGENIDIKPHFFFKLLHGISASVTAVLSVIIFKESIF